jgi:hypothetical protein
MAGLQWVFVLIGFFMLAQCGWFAKAEPILPPGIPDCDTIPLKPPPGMDEYTWMRHVGPCILHRPNRPIFICKMLTRLHVRLR